MLFDRWSRSQGAATLGRTARGFYSQKSCRAPPCTVVEDDVVEVGAPRLLPALWLYATGEGLAARALERDRNGLRL